MPRLLVIDALNLFIRNWVINPSMSTNGNPIGGTVGFLNSIRKMINDFNPEEMIICWDGAGGSQKRRTVIKEYKEGRKPIRKNYEVAGMDKQSENENKYWQQEVLMEMLNEMPIIQLMLERTEADDIIAYVTKSPKYKGWQKVIISSDKEGLHSTARRRNGALPPHRQESDEQEERHRRVRHLTAKLCHCKSHGWRQVRQP